MRVFRLAGIGDRRCLPKQLAMPSVSPAIIGAARRTHQFNAGVEG
jgi:hypothetical protein